MHDISLLPPPAFLIQVLEHCPKAGRTYLHLWEGKDLDFKLKVFKKTIKTDYLTSTARFGHDLLLLAREGLINIHETPACFHVEVVAWGDIDAEGMTLC